MEIAHIALPVPLAKIFDYRIPDELKACIQPAVRVSVEFGSRNMIGIVVAISAQSTCDLALLKSIRAVIDAEPLFPKPLWHLLHFAAKYYHSPLGEVLFHALPVPLRRGKAAIITPQMQWQLTEKGRNYDPALLGRAITQRLLLSCLQKGITTDPRKGKPFNKGYYQKLAEQGLVEGVLDNAISDPTLSHPTRRTITLNPEQKMAIESVVANLTQFKPYLLEGVTGSGKTEVYLAIIEATLKQSKQALVLVPEISLTPQTFARFKAHFSVPIEMMHSGLTDKERLHVSLRAKQGTTVIVIGTRSALFTPFKSLGLLVVDEEHDGSYKQQEGFRYHARDMAIMRARFEGVPIVLGSATPSLETLHNAQCRKYQHLTLTQRAGNATFASQHIIDLKGLVLESGVSQPLLKRMRAHLSKQQQVLLFLNRRGYAEVLICHECGWIATCPRCDKSYTYHLHQNKLSCHHCDSVKPIPRACQDCGASQIKPLGFGTEQVETYLKKQFQGIPITRIDRDSTTKKGALESYLAPMQTQEPHILVGTQILAKGHHFPHVTLVGILDVDSAFFSSDFRATERLAQIYTQVAGRAGRENTRGEVILQTYHPTHPLLTLLLNQNYHAFANKTLLERKSTLLPPFSHQALIRAFDKNNTNAPALLTHLYQWIHTHYPDPQLWMFKPLPAILSKKAGSYRWQLLLQHTSRTKLQQLLSHILTHLSQSPEAKYVRWAIDIDPLEI